MEKDFRTEMEIFEDFRTFFPTVFEQLFLREIATQNIDFVQLCEIEFRIEKWIRNCQCPQAKKWHYAQIMILSSVYKHHMAE